MKPRTTLGATRCANPRNKTVPANEIRCSLESTTQSARGLALPSQMAGRVATLPQSVGK